MSRKNDDFERDANAIDPELYDELGSMPGDLHEVEAHRAEIEIAAREAFLLRSLKPITADAEPGTITQRERSDERTVRRVLVGAAYIGARASESVDIELVARETRTPVEVVERILRRAFVEAGPLRDDLIRLALQLTDSDKESEFEDDCLVEDILCRFVRNGRPPPYLEDVRRNALRKHEAITQADEPLARKKR